MKYLKLIMGYFPFVLAGVMAVEDALKGQPGQTKKTAVLASVQAAAQVGEQVPEDHVKAISTLIDSVVKMLNDSGIFGHAATLAK
jgi:hypothetical protein